MSRRLCLMKGKRKRLWRRSSKKPSRLTAAPESGIRERPVNASILPLSIWLVGGAACLNAAAGIESVGSSSGQFTAHEIKTSAISTSSPQAVRTRLADSWGYIVVAHRNPSDTDESSVQLDPSLLVVSCERLKGLFLGELRMDDQWQGRINLIINPALDEKKRPRLTAVYHPDGWSYSLELPKTISTRVLVRALMDTLLLEVANRNAGSQCSEIPFWLVEGMSAQIQSFNLPTLILQPSEQMSGNRVKLEGLDKVRDQLRRHAPLSFQNLSWPTEADVDGEGSELYRSCAQLFLEQLLQFKDGNRLLREMLRQLPRHLNWQTAFLAAFHAHFNYLLDVEKWWGLSSVDFARSDLAEPLSTDTCGKELQDALDVPVQVHFDTEQFAGGSDADVAGGRCEMGNRGRHCRDPAVHR